MTEESEFQGMDLLDLENHKKVIENDIKDAYGSFLRMLDGVIRMPCRSGVITI